MVRLDLIGASEAPRGSMAVRAGVDVRRAGYARPIAVLFVPVTGTAATVVFRV
ncbi:hypothetical protein PAMC26510_32770 [Caballeronia sordidicola]|uniref:Uncharacterized protein n=1 Tax=Caballeronia sordidicola TaxID=196367 RepID=A0A242M7I5_CABSO|nr:hypothetical protein PAMC26510_32770 [Caballeronia sordidicola]